MIPSLTQLQYLIAVHQEGHFGRAARRCHVSQPSLSMQIHKVEDYFETTIFDRAAKPIQATEKGRSLIEQAYRVLAEHEKLVADFRREAKVIGGRCSLAVIPTLAPYLLPIFLRTFAERYPKVDLSVDELKTDEIIERLKQNRLDCALLATPLHEGLEEVVLFHEPFFVYAGGEAKLPPSGKVKQSDLDPDKIWLLEEGHCFREQVVRFCGLEDCGKVLKNVSFAGGTLETLKHLVAAGGDGYTLLPFLQVHALGETDRTKNVRAFAAPAPSREVSLVHRSGHFKEDIFEVLAASIRSQIPQALRRSDAKRTQMIEFR